MSVDPRRTPGGAILLDGRRLLDETVARLRDEVAALEPETTPCLATVLVADDRPSQSQVRAKHARAQQAGMTFRHAGLRSSATQQEVEAAVRALAADPGVHGVFVQLPLPAGLDTARVLDLVPPVKDIDGLSEVSMGRLLRGQATHAPCAATGVTRLLEQYRIPTSGSRAVVIGRSPFVALPLALLLAREGSDADVTIANPLTGRLAEVCRTADIVVAAAGIPRLVTADHVKPGATVVDAGVSRVESGLTGDVDFDSVQAVAGAIAPMPGGTGPMTIACLLENTLEAARMMSAPRRG